MLTSAVRSIPRFALLSFLKENNDKIKGLIITHGHEDHIGGISFLLQNIEIPVIYAPKIAADLIEKKLKKCLTNKNERSIIANVLKRGTQQSTLKSKQ